MEDFAPILGPGARVKIGQIIGNATGGPSGIETGWANRAGTGPLVPYNGAPDGTPMPGGINFKHFLGYAAGGLPGFQIDAGTFAARAAAAKHPAAKTQNEADTTPAASQRREEPRRPIHRPRQRRIAGPRRDQPAHRRAEPSHRRRRRRRTPRRTPVVLAATVGRFEPAARTASERVRRHRRPARQPDHPVHRRRERQHQPQRATPVVLGWEGATIGDLRAALTVSKQIAPKIKAAIRKRQAEIAALKARIRANLKRIADLQKAMGGTDPNILKLKQAINSASAGGTSVTDLKKQLAQARAIAIPAAAIGAAGDQARNAKKQLVAKLEGKLYQAEHGHKVNVADLRNEPLAVEANDKKHKQGYRSEILGLDAGQRAALAAPKRRSVPAGRSAR